MKTSKAKVKPISKSETIRKLYQEGLKVGQIREKTGYSSALISIVVSDYKKKLRKAKAVKAATEVKQAMDVIETKPTKLIIQPQFVQAALDLINNPPHYKTGGVDFLDYAEAKGLTENAYLFNVVKYVTRAGKKLGVDPVQDLEKAEFYLKREIARRKTA